MVIDELINFSTYDYDNTIKSGLKLFHLIGSFRDKCISTVKVLVNDLAFRESHKLY